MLSPRYLAEAFAMPRYLREMPPSATLDAIERSTPDYFIPVWMEAGFRFTPTMFYELRGDLRVGILSLPRPQQDTEAYLAAIVGKVSDPTFLRYFLWEAGTSVMSGQPMTMIGEWQEQRHLNYGSGPPFTGRPHQDVSAFRNRVVEICTK